MASSTVPAPSRSRTGISVDNAVSFRISARAAKAIGRESTGVRAFGHVGYNNATDALIFFEKATDVVGHRLKLQSFKGNECTLQGHARTPSAINISRRKTMGSGRVVDDVFYHREHFRPIGGRGAEHVMHKDA